MTQQSWKKLIDEISLGPKQKELIRLFIDFDPSIGKTLSEIYQGAIQILSNKGIKDRFAATAHELRELMSVFKRDRFDLSGQYRVKKEDVKKILKELDSLGGPPEEIIQNVAKEFDNLYSYFSKIAHHEEKADPENFSRNFEKLENIFLILLKPHFNIVGEVEELIKKPKTSNNIKQLIIRLRNRALCNLFFEKVDPDWLKPLARKEFFKNPPEPIKNENGSISFPIWPQSRYLIRVTDKRPKEVIEIIRNCEILPEKLNPYVLSDFVEAALKMPSKFAKEIVNLVEKQKWLSSVYPFLLPDKLGDLVEKLAKNNETESALKLAELLFDVKIDEPIKLEGRKGPFSVIHRDAKPLYDEWRFEQIIKNKTRELKERAIEEFISILCKRLAKALFLEQKQRNGNRNKKIYDDLSHIWRPNIDYARRHNEDVKDIFITTIIEILKELGEKRSYKLSPTIDILKKHSYPVFRRIKLYIYSLLPEHFKKEIKEVLINKNIITADNLQKEYFLLLKENFIRQDKETQTKILKLIERGPQLRGIRKFQKGEIEKRKNYWRLKYLHLVKDFLPDELQKKYKRYMKEFGEPKYDEWEIKTWRGPTSPLSSEDLKEKLNKEGVQGIINYLMDWEPPKDLFGVPSPEGLGRILNEIIKESPEEFSKLALLFYNEKIRPVYIYHLFCGLQQALKDKKCFNWNPVIDLTLQLIQSKELATFEKPSEEFKSGWDSVMKSIVDLYGEGFELNCPIPFKRRADVWKAIEKISEHEEPDLEYEKKYGDPTTLSINTVRDEAMHTVVKYALWCAQHLYPKNKKQSLDRLVPEAQKVLERHLDIRIDPSTTIRAVYGWYLPNLFYLNKKWILDNKNKILPKEPKLKNLWLAAFETYLTNNVDKEIFDILKEDYKRAIDYIKEDNSERRHFADIKERLPQHLMVAYTYGFTDDRLINKFFDETTSFIRGNAIGFIGRNLLNKELQRLPEDKISFKLEKLKTLWGKRLNLQEEKQTIEEFKEFGWWFVNSPFNKKWTINALLRTLQITRGEIEPTHQVIDEFSNYADDYPLLTVECLNLIARGDKQGWETYSKKEEYKTILQRIKQSKDRTAKEKANRLINYLGEKGYLEFKELL